jgi:hypothetical protein
MFKVPVHKVLKSGNGPASHGMHSVLKINKILSMMDEWQYSFNDMKLTCWLYEVYATKSFGMIQSSHVMMKLLSNVSETASMFIIRRFKSGSAMIMYIKYAWCPVLELLVVQWAESWNKWCTIPEQTARKTVGRVRLSNNKIHTV